MQNISAAGVGQAIFTNAYSPTNNRLTVSEIDGTLVTYGYDAHSQLTSEARSGTYAYNTSYVYDPNGNRLQKYDSGALTQYSLNAANELTLVTPNSGAPTTNLYDAVGNLTGANTGFALTTQVWSPENRLASYGDSTGNNEQYVYSDDGFRKKRVNGASTTVFTYDESALLLETDGSLNLQARYTNKPATWGGLASQSRSGVSSFYGFDSQQSARILVSIAGVITDSYSYKAFGEELQSGSGTVNPYRYVALALYYRELADLLNAWNRWLKPSIGRWDSRDLIGFAGGDWNLYRYVSNNPVVGADPSGLDQCTDACSLAFLLKGNFVSIIYQLCVDMCEADILRPNPPCNPPHSNPGPAKPSGPRRSDAPYGECCGPQTIAGTGGIDQLDRACCVHDDCFTKHHCTASNQFDPKMKGECAKCSQALCQSTANLTCADAPDYWYCRIVLAITHGYACAAGYGISIPPSPITVGTNKGFW